MSLSEDGVTDSKILERIRNENIAIYQLRALGVFSHALSPIKSSLVYGAYPDKVGVRNAHHPVDRRDNRSNTGSGENLLPANVWLNGKW